MSVFKQTFSRALPIYKSDNALIPFPTVIIIGQNTSLNGNDLINTAALFTKNNIKAGDIVVTELGLAATVIQVINDNQIRLNTNIFGQAGVSYTIYQDSSQTSIGNRGCFIYAGTGGALNVQTIGGDVVVFTNVASGSILPVQVNKVFGSITSASDLIALW